MDQLYGEGGELYTFIHAIRNDFLFDSARQGMRTRADELLSAIVAHDAEVERIAKDITAEIKAEMPTTEATGPERIWVSQDYVANPSNCERLLSDDIEYVRADLVAVVPAGWMDIAGAPKDGTWQVVARLDGDRKTWWERAIWSKRSRDWKTSGGYCIPTHYLPLPNSVSTPSPDRYADAKEDEHERD